MNQAKQYLHDLTSFRSVSPNDAGAIDYIAKLLEQNGFNVTIKVFGNEKYQVKNLYAKYYCNSLHYKNLKNCHPELVSGSKLHVDEILNQVQDDDNSSCSNICFAGHVDVVPPGPLDLWQSDPFTPTEINGKIVARGAADMKGALAAGIAAALDFINVNKSFKGAISFLITSDEEGEAEFGTKKMIEFLQDQNERIDLVILGEPTSEERIGDQIKIGRRGSMNFTLDVIGEQGHVAYPNEAINPIRILVQIMHELVNLKLDGPSEFFEASNLEITSVDVGNPATNVIPEKACVKFNIRFNDLQTRENLAERIKNIIEKYTKSYRLTDRLSAEVFLQKPDRFFYDILSIVQDSTKSNTRFATNGGTSDARFIYKYYKVIELGAKHSSAHKINEHIEIRDLQILYKVYHDLLYKLNI
jgi:succinyl-diaminopimelate desuccinylase